MNRKEVEPGMPAPDFTLPSTKGDVSLSELLKSKTVVLAFYGHDGAEESRTALSLFKEEYSVFDYLEAEVLGISVDSLDSHASLVKEMGHLPYALVSDQGMTLGAQYGVLNEDGKGYRPALYVINRWGNVSLKIPDFEVGNQEQYMYMLQALGLNVLDEDR